MSEATDKASELPSFQQTDFEKITLIVTAEFQIEEALMEHGIPTYYLKQPQETKQPFLRLLKNLKTFKLIAFLRRVDRRLVLKVAPKPPIKASNIRINIILFFATVVTTFVTGYFMLPPDVINPFISGLTFATAILTVFGAHEMGHKLTANKKKVEATPPYFIPGPPPFGSFGAVIMQKSLPPNKDALFDIGANGPIAGFIMATIVSLIGLTLLIPSPPIEGSGPIKMPVIWLILLQLLSSLNMIPQAVPPNSNLIIHPIAYAGWVGILVTLLNLLPAAMLDGGHVARSIASGKLRYAFTMLSIFFLFLAGSEFWFMAFLVIFMAGFKHPGPLDDVSNLSDSRKLLTIVLIAIFGLCFFYPF